MLKKFPAALLLALCFSAFFLLFAIHHLANFETTDEKLWKENRIAQYKKGMEIGRKIGDWSGVNINDKPGVTLALLSGINLDKVPDPTKLEKTGRSQGKIVYRIFKTSTMEEINFGLRFPVVAATATVVFLIILLVFFWTKSLFITTAAGVFIGLSPLLIGITQILNPDALFWSMAFGTLVSYLLMLQWKNFIGWPVALLVGAFFGLALLSKYTANLFILFFLLLLVFSLFEEKDSKDIRWILPIQLLRLIIIFTVGYSIYAWLYPVVINNQELFLRRTIFSKGIGQIFWPVATVYGVLFLDAFFIEARITSHFVSYFKKYFPLVLRLAAGALLALFIFVLANAWSGGKLIPLDHLRESYEFTNEFRSPQLDLSSFSKNYFPVKFAKIMIVESSNFVFSLPLAVLILAIIGCVLIIVRGKSAFSGFVLFSLLVPWIFFCGGWIAQVFVNARYALFLQPVFALFSAIIMAEISNLISRKALWGPLLSLALAIGIFFSGLRDVKIIIPHYFNYENDFLPKKYSLADSWSYGTYEAAKKLNELPEAKSLKVWSDRQAFCRYFVGKCIRSANIDRSIIVPDYFVITRRNVVILKNRFHWKDSAYAFKSADEYYSQESLNAPYWEVLIGQRPDNYVKIIKSEESQGYIPN